MFLRIVAVIFGIGFICAGVAGFLPSYTTDGMLFGYFEVGAVHNIIHLVSGVIAIMAATSFRAAKLYFQIFGILYAVAGIWGFWTNGDLYIMQVNTADNILHIIISVVSLYLGFSAKEKQAE